MWNRLKREAGYLVAAGDKWTADGCPTMAAAVAYYAGLSFFPLLLVLIAGVGVFFRFTHSGADAEQAILSLVQSQLSGAARREVEHALAHVRDRSLVNGPLALLLMFLSSMAGFVQLQQAFDQIDAVPSRKQRGILAGIRMVLRERLVAFLMLCGLGVLILAVFIIGLALSATESLANELIPGAGSLWEPFGRFGLALLLNVGLFTVLYHTLPRTPVRFCDALRGGILAAVTWEIGRQVLAQFLIGTKYTTAYGVVGSFIAVMLWCYYAVAVLLLGAEYLRVVQAGERRR